MKIKFELPLCCRWFLFVRNMYAKSEYYSCMMAVLSIVQRSRLFIFCRYFVLWRFVVVHCIWTSESHLVWPGHGVPLILCDVWSAMYTFLYITAGHEGSVRARAVCVYTVLTQWTPAVRYRITYFICVDLSLALHILFTTYSCASFDM